MHLQNNTTAALQYDSCIVFSTQARRVAQKCALLLAGYDDGLAGLRVFANVNNEPSKLTQPIGK
jgi:hypothetical protein